MTIEERANIKYGYPVEPNCFETDKNEQWYNCGMRDGFVDGAKEQREIDIQRAVEYLCGECTSKCEHICMMCNRKNELIKVMKGE